MKPPLPSDVWDDFDHEDVETEAAGLRDRLEQWALGAEDILRDPRLKPAKAPPVGPPCACTISGGASPAGAAKSSLRGG